jgi:hypothetical protein
MILLRLFFPLLSLAFIPKPATIIQKTVENNGAGIYAIEQEVQFPSSQEPVYLRENWLIENENKMRLVVTGTRELKDKIHWVFVYDNGIQTQNLSGVHRKELDADFIEKYFHYRRADHLQSVLAQLKIVPSSVFAKKPYKLSKEPDTFTDPHVRLARSGGVIVYAFGLPTEVGAPPAPAFFIEQDQFVLRKFRLPSEAEVSADHFSTFARGLNFPRARTVRWGDKQVLIQTIHVQPKTERTIPASLEASTSMDVPELGAAKSLVEEFYKRFR